MAVFVLVSGWFTGSWIWEDVAERMRASGAEVHPVALTGTGGRGETAPPGTDLETHIGDVLRVVDGLAAPEVVLVGHGYGIHPVLGAADRRPERVARVVHLDAGMPGDGDTAAQSVPDPDVRTRLLGADPGVADVPPPAVDGWQRWGSTAGLGDEALARLTDRAVPQPVGTLTRPLKLSGAAAALPSTGVLCTGGGMTIAILRTVVAGAGPLARKLTDPAVRFFELATGHWPMLSCPGELADVLRQAAAGEGHRIAPSRDVPPHLRPFVLEVPERPRERVGRVDLYLPDGAGSRDPRPAVLFVHGGPLPPDVRPTPRDWPGLAGHARYAAELGAVGAVVDHRLHGFADYPRAAGDLAAAVDLLRADPRVDPDRIALWFFSGGGLLLADALAAPGPWLRCVAASYPVLAPLPSWGPVDPRFRPVEAVGAAGRLPIVLTRVGRENPGIAATVAEFLGAAGKCGAAVDVVDLPDGQHGFDTAESTGPSRRAVARAMRSVLTHLRA
ncbi:alpha/beta hydrolase [Kitasatospora sp. DSM 101779]|uniref:alpha/beta hydrolase n=1 Tax=Kitasatospora sp. DSM 101779 TaxID=2853165 RepID=UPI0021D9978A|nr:alpha/beta hydrolase [Kitasatospora sp. DSM 101779]MCU7820948.1 dienelactone hydrolase family protein [Kitasatospora sp. DSM 101779]